jgi:sugar phosphate isomerase/epimerase
MIHVGAVSLGWSGTPLPEVFQEIAALGGTAVEVNGNAAQHHGIPLNDTTLPQIQAWAEETNLTILSISGYCDFAQTDKAAIKAEIERLFASVRAAAKLRAPVVRTFVGDVKPGLTLAYVRPYIVDALREAAARAGTLGVALGIENHGRLINDGPALVKLVEAVNAPNLGFTLDTGNFAWAGHDPDQVRADIEAVLPYTINVHIKDGVWTNEGFTFVPAGEGDLPLAWLLKTLITNGYDGPIYSEYEGSGDIREGTRQSIAYLRRVVADVDNTAT